MSECMCPDCRSTGPEHEAKQGMRGTTPPTRPFKATAFAEWWFDHLFLTLREARTQYAAETQTTP